MGLGLNMQRGDFLTFVKYDAKAGKWLTRDGDEITNFQAIVDCENAEVGWIMVDGPVPDFQMCKAGGDIGAKPGDKYKQGIRFKLALGKDAAAQVGEAVVEFTSTAATTIGAFDEIYEDWEKNGVASDLPIVGFTGTTPIKGNYGTNYRPNLEIVGWDKGREKFDAAMAARNAGQQQSEPARQETTTRPRTNASSSAQSEAQF